MSHQASQIPSAKEYYENNQWAPNTEGSLDLVSSKGNFIKNRWDQLADNKKKAFKIGCSLTAAAIIAVIGLTIAMHFGLGNAVKDFMNHKMASFFHNKFVPLFKDHVGPALKSSAFKVAHFMNSTLTISGSVKVPVWALFASGLGLAIIGKNIPRDIKQYKDGRNAPQKPSQTNAEQNLKNKNL